MFHANMLKKYFERNQEVSEEQTDLSVQQLSAVILENEDKIGGEIDLCTTLQKETFRDVEISSDLSESQRQEVVDILEEFQDVFTDVPALTTVGEHSITQNRAFETLKAHISCPPVLRAYLVLTLCGLALRSTSMTRPRVQRTSP